MSTIIPSKGVEFSDVDLYENPDLNLVSFNDLSIVAGWSSAQRVRAMKEIVVYHEGDLVVGIELVYVLANDQTSPRIIHGKETKNTERIVVENDESVIAAHVGTKGNNIKALYFTKTNLKTGNVETLGHMTTEPGVTYSVAFGEISALRGIKVDGEEGPLVTLGFQTRYFGPENYLYGALQRG